MTELIDRAALLERIETDGKKYGITVSNRCNFQEIIRSMSPVDAAPVVRCGDCRHSSKIANSTKGERHCWSLRGRNNGDGFSRVKRDGFCDEGARTDADAPERAGGNNNAAV